MNHVILTISGVVAWIAGVAGMFMLRSSNKMRKEPWWQRLAASLKLKVGGQSRPEVVASLFQVVGVFWFVAGIGFWLIKDVVNPDSIRLLVGLVYVMPVMLLAGASLRSN